MKDEEEAKKRLARQLTVRPFPPPLPKSPARTLGDQASLLKALSETGRPSARVLSEQARIDALNKLLRSEERGKGMEKVKRRVFYSFHFDNDVMRVQQIRSIGAIEDNAPVAKNEWETIKKKGEAAVKKWIDDNMQYRKCVIVLVGEETAKRPYVQYEIRKAWEDGKGLFGIYIHNIKCPRNGKCNKGPNPFDEFTFSDGDRKGSRLSTAVKCYNPKADDAYNDIKQSLEDWVDEAIENRKK
jgi:hypothetical protein